MTRATRDYHSHFERCREDAERVRDEWGKKYPDHQIRCDSDPLGGYYVSRLQITYKETE